MASDIVPIQLSLTEGDLVTLWAPRWREDGEEWEAFLGDDDNLFAFTEVTELAAFVRTNTAHDLVDHPSWSVVLELTADELVPDDTRSYDIIGVPEVVAEDPDTWTIGELSEITDMLRSIAEVCELEAIDRVLGAAPAFGMLNQGTLPFAGREGARLWAQLVDVVAKRWDEVVDALDGVVRTPEVDAAALATAEKEMAAQQFAAADADAGVRRRRHRGRGRGLRRHRGRPGARAAGFGADLLGRGRDRPDPHRHRRRRVPVAALLPRRQAGLPRQRRQDRRLHRPAAR